MWKLLVQPNVQHGNLGNSLLQISTNLARAVIAAVVLGGQHPHLLRAREPSALLFPYIEDQSTIS